MTEVLTNSTGKHADTVDTRQSTLSIRVHSIDESFHQHVAADYWAWRAIFDNDDRAKINQHPDLVLTELRYSREDQHRSPTLITCHVNGQAAGAAVLVPKSISGEKRFGPTWNLQGYRLVGNRLLGSSDVRIQNQLLDGISQHLTASKADFLLAEDVESTDPLLALVEQSSHELQLLKPAPFQRRHTIDLPATYDDYWNKFNAKTRSTLRRKIKQFGECRLERISKPFQIPDFLVNAQKVAKRSWQNDLLGLRIHNDDYELAMFTFLATQNTLRSYILWKEDTPVSFCIGTQHNGVFHYEEVGYDRDYSKKSPGQILVIKVLEDMYEHERPNTFDFGGGDAEYKRQFGTSISESGHIWLLRPGIRSRMIAGYLSGRRAMSQALRGTLARTGLLDRVRRLTRRGLNS